MYRHPRPGRNPGRARAAAGRQARTDRETPAQTTCVDECKLSMSADRLFVYYRRPVRKRVEIVQPDSMRPDCSHDAHEFSTCTWPALEPGFATARTKPAWQTPRPQPRE